VLDFEGVPGKDGVPAPWQFDRWSPLLRLGDSVADARVVERDGRRVLQLHSDDSGFIVGMRQEIDISSTPIARWRWMAEALPVGGHFAQRETNDQVLQLLFGFEGGMVVGYIWDTVGPRGASGDGMTWREDTRVIVVRDQSDGLGRWYEERRDLSADFEMLFGQTAPTLVGVAVQSNSQHTRSSGSGYLGPIVLEASSGDR